MGGGKEMGCWFPKSSKEDNEVYWHCKQLEEDCRKGHTRNAFVQVEKVQTPFTAHESIIKNKKRRKKTCLTNQVSKTDGENTQMSCVPATKTPKPPKDDETKGSRNRTAILQEEVTRAISQLPYIQQHPRGWYTSELLTSTQPTTITTLRQKFGETNTWPQVWKLSLFIPLSKKRGNSRDCSKWLHTCPHSSG